MTPRKSDRALGPYRQPADKTSKGRPLEYPGRWVVMSKTADDPPKLKTEKVYPFSSPAAEAIQRASAQAHVDALNGAFALSSGTTLEQAIDEYPARLRELRRKAGTITTYMARVRAFFPALAKLTRKGEIVPVFPAGAVLEHLVETEDEDEQVTPGCDLREKFCRPLCPVRLQALPGEIISPRQLAVTDLTADYCKLLIGHLRQAPAQRPRRTDAAVGAPAADDTVAGTLQAVRRFLDWCVIMKWARTNVLLVARPDGRLGVMRVEGLRLNPGGKGKRQLEFDQMPVFEKKAYEIAEAGGDDWRGAVAALIAYKLQVRANQVVTRRAKDIDLMGCLFKKPTHGKNRKSQQAIPVRDMRLRPLLYKLKLAAVAEGGPAGWLFPASGHLHSGRRTFTEAQRRAILAEYDATMPRRGGLQAAHEGSRAVLAKYGIDAALVFRWRQRTRPAPEQEGQTAPPPARATGAPRHRDRGWVADQIQRICRLAGLPENATHAHGMRGVAASLGVIDGKTAAEIQEYLSHAAGSPVTDQSYVKAEARAISNQKILELFSSAATAAGGDE